MLFGKMVTVMQQTFNDPRGKTAGEIDRMLAQSELGQEQEVIPASTKKAAVIEIFGPTIQGEGPQAGAKTMFVRFGGCDYRCAKCDSPHAVQPLAIKQHAKRMTPEEIYNQLLPVMEETGTNWVTLSGGNPCMWDLTELIFLLHSKLKYVAVETQGTLAPKWLNDCDLVVISPKGPGMGEKFDEKVFEAFLSHIEPPTLTALKVVLFSQMDIEFALYVGQIASASTGVVHYGMRFFSLGNPYPPVLNDQMELTDVVPIGGLIPTLLNEYKQLLEDVVNDRRITDWRFIPQLHVLAWGNEIGR